MGYQGWISYDGLTDPDIKVIPLKVRYLVVIPLKVRSLVVFVASLRLAHSELLNTSLIQQICTGSSVFIRAGKKPSPCKYPNLLHVQDLKIDTCTLY